MGYCSLLKTLQFCVNALVKEKEKKGKNAEMQTCRRDPNGAKV